MPKETTLQLGNRMAELLRRFAHDPMIPLMSRDKRFMLEIVSCWEVATAPKEPPCKTPTTKTDRELLELAAKAAGLEIGRYDDYLKDFTAGFNIPNTNVWWNPLTDDGDAFRLAVKLNISYYVSYDAARAVIIARPWDDPSEEVHEAFENYAPPAVRRAIVRAAAAIGESML